MSGSRTFTRQEIDMLLEPMLKAVAMRPEPGASVARFKVPVSRTTSVEVNFHGPVGISEYDALLAHIAFYKTLLPSEGDVVDSRPVVEQLRDQLRRAGFFAGEAA